MILNGMQSPDPKPPGTSDFSAIDLTDLDVFTGGFPHQIFELLRREAPIWWHPPTAHTPDREGFWVVSRHADVVRVFLDHETFSSETGGSRPRGGTMIMDSPSSGVMLNMMDDPRHLRIRQLVNKGFTPRIIRQMEGDLRKRAHDIVDRLCDADHCEFVVDIARELPLQAICALLGVPQEDRLDLCDWVDTGLEYGDRQPGEHTPASRAASSNLTRYAADLIAEKRARPTDDVLSVVIHATIPDQTPSRLTDDEVLLFFLLLFAAGSETTRKTIAGSLLALIGEAEQMDLLRSAPEVSLTAVEEMVRFTTPSVYKRRTLTRDLEWGGERLRAGDKLTLWEMSANRDERVFEDPYRLDLTRDPNPHVGFGRGVHFCLGANLARLEIRFLFEELLPRFQEIELDGDPVWTRDNRLFGLKHLPIRYKSS
jgi:cytochrome P450